MNWRLKVIVSVFLTLLAVLCAAGALAGTTPDNEQEVAVEQIEEAGRQAMPVNSVRETEQYEAGYSLREHLGYVAIFRSGSEEPEIVTDIEISNLTKVDRDLLAQGISVESRAELMSLLEDLGS